MPRYISASMSFHLPSFANSLDRFLKTLFRKLQDKNIYSADSASYPKWELIVDDNKSNISLEIRFLVMKEEPKPRPCDSSAFALAFQNEFKIEKALVFVRESVRFEHRHFTGSMPVVTIAPDQFKKLVEKLGGKELEDKILSEGRKFFGEPFLKEHTPAVVSFNTAGAGSESKKAAVPSYCDECGAEANGVYCEQCGSRMHIVKTVSAASGSPSAAAGASVPTGVYSAGAAASSYSSLSAAAASPDAPIFNAAFSPMLFKLAALAPGAGAGVIAEHDAGVDQDQLDLELAIRLSLS